MSSDFVCKECGWRSEVVSAIFQIEMAASYTHDGKNYRQHSLRVTGYTLNEDMDTAITACPNCGNKGTVAESYNQIFMCRNCDKDVGDKGGFCSYNSGMFCSRCHKNFRTTCERCKEASTCELRKANLTKAEHLMDAIKTKDTPEPEPDVHSSGISAELRDSLDLDAIPESEADIRPINNTYTRDTSAFASGSGTGWNNISTPRIMDDSEDEDE